MFGSSVNLSYNIDALKYDPEKDVYNWDKGFGGPINSNDPIIKTRMQLVKLDDKNLSFTIFTLQDSGTFFYEGWVYGKKTNEQNEGQFTKQNLKGTGEIPADLLLVDFDNVYVADLLQIQNVESILIYGSMKDSPNITQIQFDRDTTPGSEGQTFVYKTHTDWYLNEKMGRSTAIASNIWPNEDPKLSKILILSNSMGGSLWQMFFDPKNPTQIDFEFETKKFADWDGQKLYVTQDYAIQYASRAKEPFGSAIFIWDFKNDEYDRNVNPRIIIPILNGQADLTSAVYPGQNVETFEDQLNKKFTKSGSRTIGGLNSNVISGTDSNTCLGMDGPDGLWLTTSDKDKPFQLFTIGKFQVTLTNTSVNFSKVILTMRNDKGSVAATMDTVLSCPDQTTQKE